MVKTTITIAQEKRELDNANAIANARALSESDKKNVSYGKWIEVEYTDSMESVYDKYSEGASDIPFSNMVVGGTNDTWTSHGSRQMDNNDYVWPSTEKSGYFKCVLKKNWMAEIDVRTENEDYFYDNLIGGNERDRLDFSDSVKGSWDEQIAFTLSTEGDYLSIDIDDESSSVGQFTLVIQGVKYTVDTPYKMDNEAKVWLKNVWYFTPSYGTIVYDGEDEIIIIDPEHICDEGYEWDEQLQMCVKIEGEGEGNGGGNGGDETILDDTSIILIFGLVGLVVFGALYFLRGEA